jgi:hypothetical protein
MAFWRLTSIQRNSIFIYPCFDRASCGDPVVAGGQSAFANWGAVTISK